MTNEIVAQAAYNNALWCDAVCSTHQGSGEFHEELWINRFGVPRHYPDVVTLIGANAASAQTQAISTLVRPAPDRGWAVKDSFQSLDLYDFGFTPLFDAEWISATPAALLARTVSPKLQWRRVDNEPVLLDWERSLAEEPTMRESRIFMPRLLSEPDIHFVFAVDEGALVGGGILNRGAGVVGLSNVFASNVDPDVIWEGLARSARSFFPGLPVVAYDRRKEKLEAAHRVGFATVGYLRIWHIAPTQQC
jgi:hypothetical protein